MLKGTTRSLAPYQDFHRAHVPIDIFHPRRDNLGNSAPGCPHKLNECAVIGILCRGD